jgi:hypothetical protein
MIILEEEEIKISLLKSYSLNSFQFKACQAMPSRSWRQLIGPFHNLVSKTEFFFPYRC